LKTKFVNIFLHFISENLQFNKVADEMNFVNSECLCRYLNEERLEIQVWVTYQIDSDDVRPRTRDKLIGSAFLDLTSLADSRRKQHRIRFETS